MQLVKHIMNLHLGALRLGVFRRHLMCKYPGQPPTWGIVSFATSTSHMKLKTCLHDDSNSNSTVVGLVIVGFGMTVHYFAYGIVRRFGICIAILWEA
jgi:hypothetical protein